MIRRAWLLVGATGGFLAWAIFMEPRSALIEVGRAKYQRVTQHVLGIEQLKLQIEHNCGAWNVDDKSLFAMQCRLVDVHYGCVRMTRVQPPHVKRYKIWHGNVSVSITELKQL